MHELRNRALLVVPLVVLTLAWALLLLNDTRSAQAKLTSGADDIPQLAPSYPAAGYPVTYLQVTPLVVDPSVVENVLFAYTTDGTVTSMKLALTTGITKTLNQSGSVFTTTLTHAQVLNGYGAGSYQHNFVGWLRVRQGSVDAGSFSVFVNVKDDAIPNVSSTDGGCVFFCAYRQSAHLVNLWMPGLDPANPNVISVTQQFYRYFGDNYDFLNIVYIPERFANRAHAPVQNNVSGIGLAISDNSALYGSAGRLLGYTGFPLTNLFDLASTTANHEIGHQWINYLAGASLPQLQGVTPHWPLSSLAHGIMGTQCCGDPQGLTFQYTLTPIGGGNYACVFAGPPLVYNDMELYLMGLVPASSVAPHFVFTDQNQSCGSQLNGPTQSFTVQNVISAYGTRNPSYASAQKKFRAATIVVTQDRYLLSAREMAFFDYFAARGSMMTPLNFSEGFASGVTWPFYLATGRRGCLITTILNNGNCFADYLPLLRR